LLEQTYALSPKWLDATGNNAIDQVAYGSYMNILSRLRWGLRSVYVNDVQHVLTRGRKQAGQQQQMAFDDRDVRFDNMSLGKVKNLVRVAMYEWEAERHRLSNIDDDDIAFEQMLDFDIDDLAARAQQIAAEGAHPAAMFDAAQMEGLEFEGEVMDDEEREIVFGGAQSDDMEDDVNMCS
jgi:hypothetical protein